MEQLGGIEGNWVDSERGKQKVSPFPTFLSHYGKSGIFRFSSSSEATSSLTPPTQSWPTTSSTAASSEMAAQVASGWRRRPICSATRPENTIMRLLPGSR
jgi:hypothetical protein